MSNRNNARRAVAEVYFAGVDISAVVRRYLLSLTYTDNEEDETDDLQIKLEDRNGIWLTKWLNAAVQGAASVATGTGATTADSGAIIKGLSVQAVIVSENWNGGGKDKVLDCGKFELDSVDASGPPATVNIKCTSLPYSATVRKTKKSKAWEGYTLSGIAKEMAGANRMTCMYEAESDPHFKRVEQITETDISFLSKLCHDSGISLKATNNILVLFDQATYEAKPTVLTIKQGAAGGYEKYKLSTGECDTQYASCRVSYTNPDTGAVITATAKADDYDAKKKDNQTLEVTAKINSIGEGQELAAKLLRLKNKYEKTASFTLPGNPGLVAGVTVMLSGWGMWNGKYIIKQAKHKIGSSGYTTQITLRNVLEGY